MEHARVDEAIAALRHTRSPKRRSAAKALRRAKSRTACAALMEAIERELQDPRTWETQYQLIMALGECGCRESVAYLWELTGRPFDATIIYVALGDSIVRLGRSEDNDPTPVMRIIETGNPMLIQGAFQAVAMLRLRFDDETVASLIEFSSSFHLEDDRRWWIAAAAAGWDRVVVEGFLQECTSSENQQVRRAAQSSLKGKYLNWHPL